MRTVEPCGIDLAALDIAVAIPCLNEEVTIADLIDRIDEVIPTARIYVMDNASTDATPESCQHYADLDPRIRGIRHPRNIGAAKIIINRNARGLCQSLTIAKL